VEGGVDTDDPIRGARLPPLTYSNAPAGGHEVVQGLDSHYRVRGEHSERAQEASVQTCWPMHASAIAVPGSWTSELDGTPIIQGTPVLLCVTCNDNFD
jgi:hypothetical protein